MLRSFLGQSVVAVTETDKILHFMGFTFQSRDMGMNKINKTVYNMVDGDKCLGENQADRSASDHPSGKVSLGEGRLRTWCPRRRQTPTRHLQGKPGRSCGGSEPGKRGDC